MSSDNNDEPKGKFRQAEILRLLEEKLAVALTWKEASTTNEALRLVLDAVGSLDPDLAKDWAKNYLRPQRLPPTKLRTRTELVPRVADLLAPWEAKNIITDGDLVVAIQRDQEADFSRNEPPDVTWYVHNELNFIFLGDIIDRSRLPDIVLRDTAVRAVRIGGGDPSVVYQQQLKIYQAICDRLPEGMPYFSKSQQEKFVALAARLAGEGDEQNLQNIDVSSVLKPYDDHSAPLDDSLSEVYVRVPDLRPALVATDTISENDLIWGIMALRHPGDADIKIDRHPWHHRTEIDSIRHDLFGASGNLRAFSKLHVLERNVLPDIVFTPTAREVAGVAKREPDIIYRPLVQEELAGRSPQSQRRETEGNNVPPPSPEPQATTSAEGKISRPRRPFNADNVRKGFKSGTRIRRPSNNS